MIMGMNDAELEIFLERIAATTIANQAIIKCQLSGLSLTTDNVISCIGDFFDPDKEGASGLVRQIERAIVDVVEMRRVGEVAYYKQ